MHWMNLQELNIFVLITFLITWLALMLVVTVIGNKFDRNEKEIKQLKEEIKELKNETNI